MDKTVLIICAFLLVGCQTTSQQNKINFTEQGKLTVMKNYKRCSVKAIKQMDDRVSDASTIAKAAYAVCRNHYEDYMFMMAQDITDKRTREMFIEEIPYDYHDLTPLVLKVRAGKE